MNEILEYRARLLDRLEAASDEFCSACLNARDTFAPLADGEWNVHQIAVHVRDVDELVYGLRARRTASEDNPEFPNFDGESYMADHYSATEPLQEILDGLRANVKALAGILRELPTESWSRQSRHATLGHGFTLQTWVERGLAHLEEHLEVVRRLSGAT